jgi:TrmH family RNA methyltransferase
MVHISTQNAAFQKFEVLLTNRNKRHRYNQFLAEGVRGINQAIQNHWHIHAFLYAQQARLSEWAAHLLQTVPAQAHYVLTQPLMDRLSGKDEASELMAVIGMKDNKAAIPRTSDKNPIYVLFDRPANKGNLGTLLRSCDAFGVAMLAVTGHGVDLYDPQVVGASMGSFFSVPFVRLDAKADIEQYIRSLKQKHPLLKIIGTAENSPALIYDIDLKAPVLLLVGNEADGLNRHLVALCDGLAAIPMRPASSASSLNVSCAATVALYEVIRQRA